jgi:hypothetical protein
MSRLSSSGYNYCWEYFVDKVITRSKVMVSAIVDIQGKTGVGKNTCIRIRPNPLKKGGYQWEVVIIVLVRQHTRLWAITGSFVRLGLSIFRPDLGRLQTKITDLIYDSIEYSCKSNQLRSGNHFLVLSGRLDKQIILD